MKDKQYFFIHDSSAKDDPKCTMLIESLGLEGYGIFWILVETLRDQDNYKYPIKLIPALARKYNTTADKMMVVVNHYDLFEIEDDMFFSLSLNKRMESYDISKLKKSEAGKKGMLNRWNNYNTVITELLQDDNNVITNYNYKDKDKHNDNDNININNSSNALFNASELEIDESDILFKFKTRKSSNNVNSGKLFIITKNDLLFLQTTFDLIDVERALKNINIWILSNPTKLKTYSGMPRFINTWLSSIQNKKEIYNGTNNSNYTSSNKRPNGAIDNGKYSELMQSHAS